MQFQDIYKPSITATEAIAKGQFVSPQGGVAATDGNALGVAYEDCDSGNRCVLIALGSAELIADGAISTGDAIAVGDDGKPTTNDGTKPVVGRALSGAADGESVQIILIQN